MFLWLYQYMYSNYNMIVVFFSPGFDRFIPGFDRFIPGFDRFIPASIPVTETLPLQSKWTLVSKMCFVLYFEIILFHFIWNNFFLLKKTFINSENKYFLKSKIDTNPMLPPSHLDATGCRLWSTGSDRSQSSVVNSMQKGPTEIAVVQISRTEYIMKCYHNIVDQIPQKRIYGPETNGNPIVYIGDVAFEIRARAVRHGITEHTRGTPAWTKANPSSSGRSHYKTYRPVQVRIYTIYVELAIFVRKDSVPQKCSF